MRRINLSLAFVAVAAAATAAQEPRALIDRITERLTTISESLPTADGERKKLIATLESVDKILTPHAPDQTLKSAAQRMGSLVRLAREGTAKGNLGSIRAAASIYYGDTLGSYPTTLEALVPKYVKEIPWLDLPNHSQTNKVTTVTQAAGASMKPYLKDTGGWLYFNTPDAPDLYGTIVIDCEHKDGTGSVMSGF